MLRFTDKITIFAYNILTTRDIKSNIFFGDIGLFYFMELEAKYLDPVFKFFGMDVYDYDYVDRLRSDKKNLKKMIVPMRGSQEKAACADADIVFYVGLRGVGKSALLLQKAYPYIEHPSFSAAFFRREKGDADDTGSIVDASKKFYKEFGEYRRSQHDMSWYFTKGGSLKFAYYSDPYKEFEARFRGKELMLIGVDEINQMPFEHLRFLFTCNRNSNGLKNQIIGTCNPDGDSWVYRFVSGSYTPKKGEKSKPKWIDKDGYPVPEMDGKILYFFIYGEREDQVYWGETKEEVYEQARDIIDRLWKPEMAEYGSKEDMFVNSCTLITGYTHENKVMMGEDGSYYKKLAVLSPEERERDLEGRWAPKRETSTLISLRNLDETFENAPQSSDKPYRCVTADISYDGIDNSVFYYWEDFHLADAVCYKVGTETLKQYARQFLDKHGVNDRDFCFDATGNGDLRETFPDAMQYIANSKAFDEREIEVGKIKQKVSSYKNVKAQTIDNFAKRIRLKGYSVDENLLWTKFDNKMLADHFKEEYVTIAKDSSDPDGKFKAIAKKDVIQMIGHSPDFMDAWYIREFVELYRQNNKRIINRSNAWML